MTARRLRLVLILYLIATLAVAPLAFLAGTRRAEGAISASPLAALNDRSNSTEVGIEACDPFGAEGCGAENLRVRRRCAPLRRALLESIADETATPLARLEGPSPISVVEDGPGLGGRQLSFLGDPTIQNFNPPPFVLVDGLFIPGVPGAPGTPTGPGDPSLPPDVAPVPIPASAPLLLAGLASLFAARRWKKNPAQTRP